MATSSSLATLLACPACGSHLTGLTCLACRLDFPALVGVPWLLPAPSRVRKVPEWLHRSDQPVPQLPQFRAQALSMRVYAFLLAMIDGEHTVRHMTRLMEQQKLMTAEDAEPAIRRFLARALEQPGDRPPS